MNTFNYVSLISNYIIGKIYNKKDLNESIVFNIKPVRDPYNDELFYEVSEVLNYKTQVFYLKFPCNNKENFYSAVRELIIEYFDSTEKYIYTAINNSNMFTIVTETFTNLNFLFEDETDELVFSQFKEFLDFKIKNESIEVVDEENQHIYIKR